jgi:hypothetical protein
MKQAITQQAIRDARFEFLFRAYKAFNSNQAIEIEPSVIAWDVTIAQLQTVPIQWFDGVRVALLDDGLLVLTDVDSITNIDDFELFVAYLAEYMAGQHRL